MVTLSNHRPDENPRPGATPPPDMAKMAREILKTEGRQEHKD